MAGCRPRTSKTRRPPSSGSCPAPTRSSNQPAARIVAEFFDIGQSRSLPGSAGPSPPGPSRGVQAPDRGFDAVVIGEPARAFYGDQFGLTFPVFVHYGVELWVPEVGGRSIPARDAHDLVMTLYGGMSKGERKRIKIRAARLWRPRRA